MKNYCWGEQILVHYFGLGLLPRATQQKGDLANQRDLCLFNDHSSSQTIKTPQICSNDDTIEEEVLPWETLEVRLSNR
jgi:hypothetical protein